MTPTAAHWLEGFREFVTAYRRDRPVRASGTSEQHAERSILADHLVTWLDDGAARLPATHAIAITTSDIDIAEDILASHPSLATSLRSRIVVVREIEYRLWTKDHPDCKREIHVNHWSWVKAPVPPQRHAEFRAWPLRPGEAYWLHRTGTSGPGAVESRSAHLWKWNGSHAVLLEPFIRERIEAL